MKCLIIIVLGFPFAPLHADDETSFVSVPDPTWQRVEPFKELGFDIAGIDFSNQACRITCAVPPPAVISMIGEPASAPRASLIAPTEFANAVASVDIVAWQPPQGELFDGSFPGVFTRIQPQTGLGKTSGYVLAIQPLQSGLGRIRIYVATNEFLFLLTQSSIFVLNPAHTYRLVLSSRGNDHIGRIFDLSSPAAPITEISANHVPVFSGEGRCGFGVVMPHPLAADVTFDNFLAWDGSPAPLSIRKGTPHGTVELVSDIRRSMGGGIETTSNPADPQSWMPASPSSASAAGDQLIQTFQMNGPHAFFRGKSL